MEQNHRHCGRSSSTFLNLIFTVLASIFLSACQNPVQPAMNQKPYFDVTTFFTGQINLLQKDSLIVIKTSALNNQTDQHQMNWTDWKRELSLFLNSDINKASLIGKYTVDTLDGTDSGEVKIRYAANDSSLYTRLLEITFANQMVKEIHIINKSAGFLSSSTENLIYLPMKAYVIKTSQVNRFFGGNDFAAMGEISSKEKKYF